MTDSTALELVSFCPIIRAIAAWMIRGSRSEKPDGSAPRTSLTRWRKSSREALLNARSALLIRKPWFWLTEGTQEWRVYRRVDDGALQLIKQGLASYADTLSVTNDDAALPANSASVCYFAQLLDEHGNPSPLAPIGCINVAASAPPAVPMLAPLEAAGNALDPQMKVSWFCPPAGVDRYEVCIAADGQAPAPNVGGTVTPDNFSLSNPQTVSISEGTVSENFGFYRTPKAAVLGGGGGFNPHPSHSVSPV